MSHPSLQSRVRALDNATHHGSLREERVNLIVMHTTDGDSAMSSITYLNTTTDKTASYHYVIDHDGTIYRMTAPNLVAYHAGDSAWPNPLKATTNNPDRPNGGRSVNRRSIGVAWANKGEPLTALQIESALWLVTTLMGGYAVPLPGVVGHLEVSPGRKVDPPASVMAMNDWRARLATHMADL